jgi:hypothetical protein
LETWNLAKEERSVTVEVLRHLNPPVVIFGCDRLSELERLRAENAILRELMIPMADALPRFSTAWPYETHVAVDVKIGDIRRAVRLITGSETGGL